MATPDLATQVSSWVNILTPIALAVLVILQRMSAKKATQEAALQAETNLQTYRKVSDIHTKMSDVHGIVRSSVIKITPPPSPPPEEDSIEIKKEAMADAISSFIQEISDRHIPQKLDK